MGVATLDSPATRSYGRLRAIPRIPLFCTYLDGKSSAKLQLECFIYQGIYGFTSSFSYQIAWTTQAFSCSGSGTCWPPRFVICVLGSNKGVWAAWPRPFLTFCGLLVLGWRIFRKKRLYYGWNCHTGNWIGSMHRRRGSLDSFCLRVYYKRSSFCRDGLLGLGIGIALLLFFFFFFTSKFINDLVFDTVFARRLRRCVELLLRGRVCRNSGWIWALRKSSGRQSLEPKLRPQWCMPV